MAGKSGSGAQACEITRLAQSHATTALEELARLAMNAQSETARIAAIKEVLALACGKAAQTQSDERGPLVVRIVDHWARDGYTE